MRIGIIADTHDNLNKIDKAVKFFNSRDLDLVLHAGDFVAPFSAARLKFLKCPWKGVFGNNDGEKNGLKKISEGRIKVGPLVMKLGKTKITLVHDINSIDLKTNTSLVIICGHTHKPEISESCGKLIINPGECGGWLTFKSTVAILDTDTLSVKIHKI